MSEQAGRHEGRTDHTQIWPQDFALWPLGDCQIVTINGHRYATALAMLGYEELSTLANGPEPTVTWWHDGRGGMLRRGGKPVEIREGMVFNAVHTGAA